MTQTPPGWYDDGHGSLRWWDGAGWTEHVQAPGAASAWEAETVPGDAPAVTGAGLDGEPAAPVGAEPTGQGIPPIPSAPAGTTTVPPYATMPVGTPDASPWSAVPPTDQPKSRLWILWIVIGFVVVGLIVAAVLIVPAVIAWVTGAAAPVSPTSGDESAAVAAVELYDEAWQEADCAKYEEATTEAFRAEYGYPTCEDFEAQAQGFADATTDYAITVTRIEHEDAAIVVSTSESYGITVDDTGTPLDEPEAVVDTYAYTVVEEGADWRVDVIAEE